jgi:sialidase-1
MVFVLLAPGTAAGQKLWLEPRALPLPTDKMGPFVRLKSGAILVVDGDATCVSTDDGKTWSAPRPLFKRDQNLKVSNERALLRTKDGTLVLVFMNINPADRQWKWDNEKNRPAIDCQLHVWAARSLDEGKTWVDVQRIQTGYCGAIRDLIETSKGHLVVPVQRLLPDKARHATVPYVSTDGGKTWKETTLLDVGGRGHHDGSIEATVEELKDGRLWMLLRTSLDWFWEAFSADGGLTWKEFRKSDIGASSSPGMLKRLQSGRLVLFWNQLYPEGKTTYARRGAPWGEKPASYHREELSAALSEDEGKTWSKAVVIARLPGKWVSYPYVFERQPGELWVTTMQGGLRVVVRERDLLAGAGPKRKQETGLEFVGPVSVGANLVTLPDGTWEAYRSAKLKDAFKLTRIRSADHGRSWSQPEAVRELPGEPWGGVAALLDRRGEAQLFITRLRLEGAGQKIAIDRCIDVWHLRSLDGRKNWSEPQRVFKGYTGSIQGALQLSGGRILLPLGVWVGGRATAPPTGAHYCTTLYSDDDGQTWKQSPAQLTSPCHEGYNGNNYGACEPVAIEREDGLVWMLMRTQAGFLYESFSKDGVAWSEAKPARFHSSNSPAALAKLPGGRLVVAWNNCELPPRADGQGVYGGRDALHLAVSDDHGKTWRGYREAYLDRQRDATPPKTGDRGTAYPFLIVTKDGKVGVISGQGAGRRALTVVDPKWLLQTGRVADFTSGLDAWSVFSEFGPAKGFLARPCLRGVPRGPHRKGRNQGVACPAARGQAGRRRPVELPARNPRHAGAPAAAPEGLRRRQRRAVRSLLQPHRRQRRKEGDLPATDQRLRAARRRADAGILTLVHDRAELGHGG